MIESRAKELLWPVLLTALLFAFAAARHLAFRSGAFDLGIFDQAVWLISRGESPIVSLLGIHILGDHGAWILYLLAPLYLLWSSPLVLLLLQSVSYGAGAVLVSRLATQAGLDRNSRIGLAAAYALHPLLFTTNMFDFHPDAFIVPLLLLMVWAARERRPSLFVAAVLLACGCKDSLALTVCGVGTWLALFGGRRGLGAAAAILGIAHFFFVTTILIPHFSAGGGPSGMYRFSELGSTPGEIAAGIFLHPLKTLGAMKLSDGAKFLFSILAPFMLCFRVRSIALLVAALPVVLINFLSTADNQRSIVFQYGLPLLPIGVLAAIEGLKSARTPFRARYLALPAVLVFLFFVGRGMAKKRGDYPHGLIPFRATYSALAESVELIPDGVSVLAPAELVPHLSHRSKIDIAGTTSRSVSVNSVDAIILNAARPGWLSSAEYVEAANQSLARDAGYSKVLERDGITVFLRSAVTKSQRSNP